MDSEPTLAFTALIKSRLDLKTANIERELQRLLDELERGPAGGETLRQLADRLVRELLGVVRRYSGLFPKGRPRKMVTQRRPGPGRPAIYDVAEVLARVDAHRVAALRDEG